MQETKKIKEAEVLELLVKHHKTILEAFRGDIKPIALGILLNYSNFSFFHHRNIDFLLEY